MQGRPLRTFLQQVAQFHEREDPHVVLEAGDDTRKLIVHLHVAEGKHCNATYTFVFEFDAAYLDSSCAPNIVCSSRIYHPNIEQGNRVCCNLLGDEWEPGTTLESIIATLYCLLENPAFDSALDDSVEEEDYERDLQRMITTATIPAKNENDSSEE